MTSTVTSRGARRFALLTASAGLTVAAAIGATAASAATAEPHFRTPQAAMRYLAAAYNHHNAAALHEVTTPRSYRELKRMRSEAVNLRLDSCTRNRGRGDYTCTFTHGYPASLHQTGHGSSQFLVAPAIDPGWYMYALLGC